MPQVAKSIALANHEAALQTTGGVAQAIGSQLLARGSFDRQEFASKVSALTAADVTSFMQKTLKTPSTFVSYGSLSALPRHDAFSKRLS